MNVIGCERDNHSVSTHSSKEKRKEKRERDELKNVLVSYGWRGEDRNKQPKARKAQGLHNHFSLDDSLQLLDRYERR